MCLHGVSWEEKGHPKYILRAGVGQEYLPQMGSEKENKGRRESRQGSAEVKYLGQEGTWPCLLKPGKDEATWSVFIMSPF